MVYAGVDRPSLRNSSVDFGTRIERQAEAWGNSCQGRLKTGHPGVIDGRAAAIGAKARSAEQAHGESPHLRRELARGGGADA